MTSNESAIERARRIIDDLPTSNAERFESIPVLGLVPSDDWMDGVQETLLALVEAVESLGKRVKIHIDREEE